MTSTIVVCDVCGTRNRVPAAARGVPRCGKCGAPLPWVTDADDNSFGEVAERADLPVLVDVWAPWCGPCRVVGPVLERLAHEHAGQVKLVRVNADEAPGTAGRFAVQGIPTLLVLRDGTETARQVGAAPEQQLRAWLDAALSASATAR